MTSTAVLDISAEERDLLTKQVGAAKSSFYTAMRVLPAERRDAMFAIYAFCREVDDIADEPAPQEQKQRELALWRAEIDLLYAVPPARAKLVGRALAGPIRHYDLQREDFLAVIDGMAMDAERDIQGPSLIELDLYCDRVASAVGRLSIRVFGSDSPAAVRVADHLGRALQLTNILRDVDEDAERDRLYLPRDLLERHAIMSTDPATVLTHPHLDAVCLDLAAMAREHYRKADAAMAECPRRVMRAPAMMSAVYRTTLDRVIQRGWKAPRAPVSLPKLQKLWLALRAGYLF
jgi:squalene synthase HpnD